jgi:HD-GYP domain-containing protein (c-di-GMP phosphodiesterase class II)
VRTALAEEVAVSVGVACFPADGVDRESLHQKADSGLYAVKAGRAGPRDLDFAAALAAAVNLRMAVPDEEASTVPHFALAIADRIGFSDADRAMLRLAATLHDVGKVAVPDRILRKPGPLTREEFDHVRGHPAAGAEIVAHIDGLTPLADWILHSHEHVDGSGYPNGLAGDEIPLASRVLLVADAFDAITSVRPYGIQLPAQLALDELRRGAGRQFDPACVNALAGYLADQPTAAAAHVKRFGRAPTALAS